MKAGAVQTVVNGGPRADPDELLTLAESARLMRMGQSTLRALARRGAIGHVRNGRRLLFYRHRDLGTYLAARRVEARG